MNPITWLTVGIIFGAVLSVGAQSIPTWFSGAEVMEQTTAVRRMYAADDMLSAVIGTIADFGPVRAADWFRRQSGCLERRSGGRLGQFGDFAETLWRGRSTNAASILLDQACN